MDDLDGWVSAARAGGDWAFACIWQELSAPVAGYLRARGVHDVEDATSDVFLAAFKGMRGFEGDGAQFRSWLFTIAHHRGVDAVRDQVKASRETNFEQARHDHAVASAEDVTMIRSESAETVALLNQLPPDQRDVLLLRFVGDLSLEEVAAITGRRVGAVKQLQRRGVDRLRRHLNGGTSSGPISKASFVPITESR